MNIWIIIRIKKSINCIMNIAKILNFNTNISFKDAKMENITFVKLATE